MLFIRAGLFLALVVIDSNVNLIAVSSLFTAIAIIPWLSKRIYEKLYVDILEASFILNICILTSVTYHVQTVNASQSTVTNISVGIAFAEFVGIVIFHVSLRLKITKYIQRWRLRKVNLKNSKTELENSVKMNEQNSVTVVELREPLLEDI